MQWLCPDLNNNEFFERSVNALKNVVKNVENPNRRTVVYVYSQCSVPGICRSELYQCGVEVEEGEASE